MWFQNQLQKGEQWIGSDPRRKIRGLWWEAAFRRWQSLVFATLFSAQYLGTASCQRDRILRTMTNSWTARGDTKRQDGNLPILEGLVWNRNWISLVRVQKAGRGQQPRSVMKANTDWEFTRCRTHCWLDLSSNAPQADKGFLIITPHFTDEENEDWKD